MLNIKKLIYAAALSFAPALMFAQGEEVLVKVDAAKVEQNITPYLYGSCIEDVNHEIYGGLYDQKIFGESFEEPAPNPLFDNFDVYDGKWSVDGNNIFSLAHGGAKLVSKEAVAEGTVEVDVKSAEDHEREEAENDVDDHDVGEIGLAEEHGENADRKDGRGRDHIDADEAVNGELTRDRTDQLE